MSAESVPSVKSKPQEMTADEYSKLIAKWQEAYYAWNTSCATYFNVMLLNSFMQQIPIITSVQLLETTLADANRPQPYDPLREIRNARLKIPSVGRRFLAEVIDFIILHVLKIFVVYTLVNYFDFINRDHLTLNYMLSSFLYEESLSFPIELVSIEIGYLIASICFESFCLVRYGATPGKHLLRLRVIKCDHLRIQDDGDVTVEPGTILTSGAALTRSTCKTLMATVLFPAVFMALLTTQNRRTSYDIAAKTIVVELTSRA